MKTLSKLILSVLCMQLTLGTVPQAQAQVGVVQNATRAITKNYSQVERDEEEKKIDTSMEAEDYIKSTLIQNEMFQNQCMNEKNEIAEDRAFILSDNIQYADMQVKNCAQEAAKLYHMNQLADELTSEFNIDRENMNCSFCGIPGMEGAQDNPDAIAPGEKCSKATQDKLKLEPCSTYCMFKPAIETATLGISNLLGGGGDRSKDGCSKDSALDQGASCVGNLAKGLVKGIWEGITGLATLVGSGLKWVGKKLLFWDYWHKVENKTSENGNAAGQASDKELLKWNGDKPGWFQDKINSVLNFLKEITYVGLFERESKCMNCKEKGQLMCEIGGRVISDVVGFSFTLGAGYGAIKTAVTKLGPKLAGVIEKISIAAAKEGSMASRVNKVVNPLLVKPAKWIGNLAVKAGRSITKGVLNKWKYFKNSKVYAAVMKPRSSSFMGKVRLGAEKVANSVPGKIVIAPFRGIKKAFNAYIEFDSKIFAKGAATSANALNGLGVGMSKYQIAKMYSELSSFSLSGKRGMIDKNGNQVLRIPPGKMTTEEMAQFNRAGVSLTEVSSDGESIIRIKPKTFEKMKKGEFATQYDPRGLPIGQDGKTIVKLDNQIISKKTSEYTADEINKLRDQGAFFTTTDHPNALKVLDPNNLSSKGIKVGTEGEIVVKNAEDGSVKVLDASKVSEKEIEAMKKKGVEFTNKSDPYWERPLTKTGPEGSAINQTASAQVQELRDAGKIEEANQLALNEVKQLNVMKETGDISNSSMTAQNALTKQKRLNPSHLEGMESSKAVEYSFDSNKKLLRIEGEDGFTREIPVKKNGNFKVEVYQDGKKAIVTDLDKGTHEIHDFTFNPPKKGDENVLRSRNVAVFDKKDQKLLNEAMAKTVNGKPAAAAAIDEVETNLKLSGENGHKVTTDANGEKHIEIDTGPGCKPGSVTINGAAEAI
jgi:hypothetical protein